jgi:hypothetical protein
MTNKKKMEITHGEAFGDYWLMAHGEWRGTYSTVEAAKETYKALTGSPLRSWEVGGPSCGHESQ